MHDVPRSGIDEVIYETHDCIEAMNKKRGDEFKSFALLKIATCVVFIE